MPPGAAARRFTAAALRPSRIALRRVLVIARVVPVCAPLVHVIAHVEQAVPVGLVETYALRTEFPARRVIRQRFRRSVTPGKERSLGASPRGTLPFGLARQTVRAVHAATDLAKPCGIRLRVEP